jgi:hypothetical protein
MKMIVHGLRSLSCLCLAFLVWLGAAGTVAAGESTTEFWPEIDFWLRLDPAWRLSMYVPISKNIETHYREGNLVLQGDYAFGKFAGQHIIRIVDENRARQMNRFLARGGYLGGKSLGDGGEAYTEKTLFAELHLRTPFEGGFLLTHRVRSDLRWLGDDSEFSTRWRYRLQLEKEFAKSRRSIVPYANAEAYYDSRYDTVNRIRTMAGATVSWTPRIALEGNWTYQHDTHSSVTTINALNLILHIFFETQHAR